MGSSNKELDERKIVGVCVVYCRATLTQSRTFVRSCVRVPAEPSIHLTILRSSNYNFRLLSDTYASQFCVRQQLSNFRLLKVIQFCVRRTII